MLMIMTLVVLACVLFFFYLKDRKREWLAGAFLFVFAWGIVEAVCYGYLFKAAYAGGDVILVGNQMVLDAVMKASVVKKIAAQGSAPGDVYRLDPDLGYTLSPNKEYAGAPGTSAQGLRAMREYASLPAKDTFRVAVFGDSFVFCDGEKVADCWTSIAESSASNLEVLNFGISGYGLAQSILRYYKEGAVFHPDLIVFNYIIPTARDRIDWTRAFEGAPLVDAFLSRVLFRFQNGKLSKEISGPLDWFDPKFRERALYTPAGISLKDEFWAWPAFSVSNVLLVVKHKLAGQYYIKKLTQMSQEAMFVNYALIKGLIDTAKKNGSMVLFYYKYPINLVPEPVRKLIQENSQHVVYFAYQGLLDKLQKRNGVTSEDQVSNSSGHFDAKGNRIFAEAFMSVLASREWGVGQRVFAYDPKERRFTLR